jgi:hypothetical protein
MRGLGIGDTLRLGIPPGQRSGIGSSTDGYYNIHSVIGEVFTPFAHILELEIVGTFGFENASGFLGQPYATTLIFMPDSVLPPDVGLIELERSRRVHDEVVHITYEDGYLYVDWYSFVLNDPRDADAFVVENAETLAELGFYIEPLPGVAGARAFWESAEAILQTVIFNLALFSIVAIIVLVLAVFLYIRQRQKDHAISRALGNPVRRADRQMIYTLMLFALPAVVIGGTGGWFVALRESERAMEALPGTTQTELGALWLLILLSTVLSALFIVTMIGMAVRRRPILELLQKAR